VTWQPIETAPKDGTRILGCIAPEGNMRYYTPQVAVWACYHPNARGAECWRSSEIGGHILTPTHWMPLPEPPK
jgi:hypothetical protein